MTTMIKQNFKKIACSIGLLGLLGNSLAVQAQASDAVIIGPIEAMPHSNSSHNSIYSASAIELTANGYIEQEYFFQGTANRYTTEGLETGEIVDSGHPYRSRLIVRRPESAADFNGSVIIEWLNVTGGTDKDIDWWFSGRHMIRNGYAYIAVSAQRQGIDSLKEWGPDRYGDLDVTHDGMVQNDALSYDIFSAVAKAVTRNDQRPIPGQVDILGGLRADKIIATGHSQSASRLANYFNNIHPLDPMFDGAMIHGGGGRIRDDQNVRIFKIMAETDMPRRAATPQPDTDYFRQWELAGTSHVDVDFDLEFARMRLLINGEPPENAVVRDQQCALPTLSRVSFRDAMNAAYEHLAKWVDDGTLPPVAPRLKVARMLPRLEFARDEFGNILGGIRLADHAVATATNTGMNSSGGGGSRFCGLYGSHHPFDEATLRNLYPTHEGYVDAVRAVVEENLAGGYILTYAAEKTIREAEQSNIGC